MDKFEQLILRWVCLFDDFKGNEYSHIKNLVTDKSFKEFVDNVFCFKCSTPNIEEDETLYNTIKVNYQEFEIQKYEDLYTEENSVYTCVVVLLHALLKCTDNKFRDQLSERMDNEEQIILAKFLEATQSALFTKNNISKALLMFTSDKKCLNSNVSEIFSNDNTPLKSKSMCRSHLQEFCESPKSQSLIYQEKEKLIAKLTEDYKNECEENYKMVENFKTLQDLNTKLSNKLEDKEKIILFLKGEIKELSKPKEEESIDSFKVDNYSLLIKKLNQDVIDLDINNKELKNQIAELESKHKNLNEKFEKISSDYENLICTFDNVEAENMSLKENMEVFKKALLEKDKEIASLSDELCNKSIPNNPLNSSSQETNVPMNTLFDELSCLKLEEVTHDKEKYKHKYKSLRKDFLNIEHHVEVLDEQIITLKQQLHDSEMHTEKLTNEFSDKKKEFHKKNNCLENKIKFLKDSIKAKEHDIECLYTTLNKKNNHIKELSEEMDTVKKAKTMIELILSKTNTEIEALHEEHNKYVNNLLTTIENYEHSEELLHKNIAELENRVKIIQEDLADKGKVIIFYEDKMAENYQTVTVQEEQLKTIYEEKLILESSLQNLKIEIETQQKTFNNKNREMENYLEYHVDELKNVKNTVVQIEKMLQRKQDEIDQQIKLISFQKNKIETLESEKCSQEIIVSNLNSILEEKSADNTNLKKELQKCMSNVSALKENLDTTLNEKTVLENALKLNELEMKKSNDEFYRQIYDMQNLIGNQNNEIHQFKIDFEKLKDALEKTQNDFNNQLIITNKQIEIVSSLRLENYELIENLKLNSQSLLDKENEIASLKDLITENGLKISNQTDQINIEILKNHSLTKNLHVITSTMKNMQNDFDKQLFNFKTNLQLYDRKINVQTEKLSKLKEYLLVQKNELDNQINLYNNQNEYILTLETEKVNLLDKLKLFEQCLLKKDSEIINLEEKFQSCSSTINNLEEELGVMILEKIIIETDLNDTTEQFKNSQHQFTEQINDVVIQLNNREKEIIELKNNSLEMENMLEKKQTELDEQLKLTFAQNEIVNNLKSEKEMLEDQVLNANKHSIFVQDEIKSLTETLDECMSSILDLEKELDFTKTEKNSLENKLKNTIYEKDVISEELSEKLKDSTNENNDFKNRLNELKNDLSIKNEQFNFITKENSKLKEAVDCTEDRCINLQDKLKELSNCVLKKEEDMKLLEIHNLEYLTANEKLEKQINEIKYALNTKHTELENEIKRFNEQTEVIVKLNCDKESLCDKVKSLENNLSHDEYKFNLYEGKLYDCSNTINSLEQKLVEMKTVKSSLELLINKTFAQLTDKYQDLNLQLESKENNILKIQEKLIQVQNNFEEQNEQFNEQIITINLINAEKVVLLEKTSRLQEYLNEKECSLKSLQEKILDYKKQFDKLETLKLNLESDLVKNKLELNDLHQKSKQRIEDMENKCSEIQEQFDKKQNEYNDYIVKYNCQVETVDLLTLERDNLISETETLKNTLLKKDSVIASNEEKLLEYKENNGKIKAEKDTLEIECKKTIYQLETTCQELTQQLKDMENKYTEIQEQFNTKLIEINEYIDKHNCHMETITLLTSERNNLISETEALKNTLLNKDNIIMSNKKKLIEYEKKNDCINTEKIALEIELKKIITQLKITYQELTQQLEDMEKKLSDLQENLNSKHVDIETQVEKTNKQIEVVSILTSEKDNLIIEIDALKNSLLEKENTLVLNHKKLNNFEMQLEELNIQKKCLESELNETKVRLDNVQRDLVQQRENVTNKLQEAEERVIIQQKDLEKQTEAIKTLICEKNDLLEEINMYKETLIQKENTLSLNQDKFLDNEKQIKEIELRNTSLKINILELNKLKVLLNNLRQEFTEKIVEVDKILCEGQEKISYKQFEIKNQIKLKNNSLPDVYQKVNDLKNIKNELELVHKKEKTNFETSLVMYSNSLSRHTPMQDHHENSLMEVITSADTFIEENGIQFAQVENYEEYSIIEKLKKLFEALKMFIININNQGNGAITNVKHEYASNEAYDNLLIKSDKQQKTIEHLESEISKLKAECNYKMTKIQQKTQEFVTAEYEKKFERKREQMKQFCKDLETKIHQDYETKLMKYKEKIKKDEMHIKELGQQLWEVSEKYLKLQQKDRRESTMSLPFESLTISQTAANVPKYNSFTLPKCSSAGQIRSLVEETTRSHQDISKRNVPSGIGKKFSLSSGKIFPKEEDEEGEMFNHSCLADLKQGRVRLNDNSSKQYNERLSELQARNSLCPPHLKSCYAVETNFLPNASLITEEDIKTLANYSDCESENLIPNDRNKKKDRNQTSYKKPGPPTPSKNGGRSSLTGNTKILMKEPKESNVNKRRASSTPNKLFSLFMGKK